MQRSERSIVPLVAFMFLLAVPATSLAEVPDTFTYTGNLQKDGQPYDGMVSATFELYDSETGGESVWSETYPTLQVQDGQFTARLGAKEDFGEAFDGQELWLEVTVEGTTMTPRQHVGATPYARKAARADEAGNAETVGGKSGDDLADQAASSVTAADVSYDDSSAPVTADNTQEALDTVAALKDDVVGQ
jgi:hypothetical protein